VERKNRTVQEAARTMLNEAKLSEKFWRDSIYTAVHILNQAQIRANHEKTPYELWFGRPTFVKHFRVFGSKCYIKRDEYNLGKFDSRSNEGIFLGYSPNKNAYKCYKLRFHKIVESANVEIDDLNLRKIKSQYETNIDEWRRTSDDEEDGESQNEEDIEELQENKPQIGDEKDEEETPLPKEPSKRVQKNHLENHIIGDKYLGVETRRKLIFDSKQAMFSIIEPKNFAESSKSEDWIKSINGELDQIEKNDVWELVPRPEDKNVVGTKWILKNKVNENGQIIKNKAILVCIGYAQVEGIDF
jgi:hypothetical protein